LVAKIDSIYRKCSDEVFWVGLSGPLSLIRRIKILGKTGTLRCQPERKANFKKSATRRA
jgi:hypothetical protein